MRDFLEALWGSAPPGTYGELRFIRPGGRLPILKREPRVKQFWARLPLRDGQILGELTGEWDEYFGVLPRKSMVGTAGSVDQSNVRTLWADIDAKSVDKSVIRRRLNACPQQPSIIVDSGYGYHAYWLLREPTEYPIARDVMKGLAQLLGGDHTHDAARVLRVPGTYNRKHGTSVPVRLVYFDPDCKFYISDFGEYLQPEPDLLSVTPRNLAPAYWVRHEGREAPAWVYELAREGAPKGTRSEAAFRLVIWLLRYGWTDKEIQRLFLAHPRGIGEKVVERGTKWLDLTVMNARKQV